jgi:hypothetical protein
VSGVDWLLDFEPYADSNHDVVAQGTRDLFSDSRVSKPQSPGWQSLSSQRSSAAGADLEAIAIAQHTVVPLVCAHGMTSCPQAGVSARCAHPTTSSQTDSV